MPASASKLLALGGTALAVLATGTAAQGQQMSYEDQTYQAVREAAEALGTAPAPAAATDYVSQPVVQPLPAERAAADAVPRQEPETGAYWTDADGMHHPLPPAHPGVTMVYPAHPSAPPYQAQMQPGMAVPQVIYAYPPGYQQGAYQAVIPPMPQPVDRESWIADCRAYLDQRRSQGERGTVGGAVLGAIAGGVIGNRVADGERLGGTLIGAGVGGLAGLFVGQALDRGRGGGRKRDCDRWYDEYRASYPAGQMWYGGYIVIPQTTVVIHQSAPMVPVVREIVREEWVEEEVVQYRKPAPAPAKKIRYIKQKPATKPIKGG